MKLGKIEVRNYLGIEHVEAKVGDAGLVAEGGNARGKSAILKSVEAGLQAQGIGPECIRVGADRTEILLDFDAIQVRRVITQKGSTVAVTAANGDKWAKPQTRLLELFPSRIDPLAFFLGTPAERRAQILSACPVQVEPEDLKRWTGEDWKVEEGKHGLDVVDQVRQHYYDERKRVNAEAKEAARKHEEAQAKAAWLAKPEHDGVMVPALGMEDAPVKAAEAELQALQRRKADAEAMEARTKGTRERIEKLRAEAGEKEHKAPRAVEDRDLARMAEAVKRADESVAKLRAALSEAEQEQRALAEKLRDAKAAVEAYDRILKDADSLRDQAADLEATLAETAIAPPAAEDFAAAEQAVAAARAHADLVRAARAAHDALAEAADLADVAADTKAEAERLDRIVTTLTTTAPVELAARSQTIPGLAMVGGVITLDGRTPDNLSGAEQMRFAVDLTKRINKGKLMIIDELEKLDADRREEFLRMCTGDGWQVIGAQVTRGELKLVAIEPSRVTMVEPPDGEEAPAP
jgi:hypothetical protein